MPTVPQAPDAPADCRCAIDQCDLPDPHACPVHGQLHTMVCVDPDGWRRRVAETLDRRERARQVRDELAQARRAGLARRHAQRLRGAP